MNDRKLPVAENGLITDEKGRPLSVWVDSHITFEAAYPGASAIIFRLYDSEEHPPGTATPIAAADAHQFRISTAQARKLALGLLTLADELEGRGAPRQ